MKSVHRLSPLALLLSSVFLSGCLGGGGGSDSDPSIGRLNYNGFSGLSYQTASQSGTTDAQGRFRYYPGETLSFKVGNLPLVQGVPAKPYISPLEFFADVRTALQTPIVDDQNLRSHQLTEAQLLDNATLMNLTRFLMSLDWTQGVPEGEGIDIRQRVIDQLNTALTNIEGTIDFSVPEAEFAALGGNPSPANQLLAQICFYPEDNALCDDPPTQEEINAAPVRPANEADWDPNVEYQQDLQAKRDRIVESIRTLDDIKTEDAQIYLTHELDAITTAIGNQYYLENHVAEYPASDTGIKSVRVEKIAGDTNLTDIEAISTRPTDVTIHSWSWQTADVEFFVSGDTGGESELLINFRPQGTYRWIRKSLRILIR
ncbi:organic solvent ABC transporter permease [Marinobacter koreensis]|uniref:Organic solvent ABC transporter permease n=1 Tax=Marinobacter koreensis TaxID=335974 RepID=A0ABW0RJ36_9GAMM|nr:organic solvent ABC transporter permease [Marinobacter koreensis]MCK7548229.1 organic solvent ABC transporter permease [Marinobacter koreensis]